MKFFLHYIQHDQMDCGPTCLRMVAAHYGKRYSLERLREKSFLTREEFCWLVQLEEDPDVAAVCD